MTLGAVPEANQEKENDMQTTDVTIAQQIADWLYDIHLMDDSRTKTAVLCYCYNWATNPARLETDRESRATARLARYCMDRLRTRSGWHESDSGRLWI